MLVVVAAVPEVWSGEDRVAGDQSVTRLLWPPGPAKYECPVCGDEYIWDKYSPDENTVKVIPHMLPFSLAWCEGSDFPVPAEYPQVSI